MATAKAVFTLTVFEILLSKGRSVLWPAQLDTGDKRVKVSLKNQKNIGKLLKLLQKWLTYKRGGFEWFLKFFYFVLPFHYRNKLKNLIFEMLIITQTLNTNNLRATNAKSINLHIIRKLVECSLKTVKAKAMFPLTVFRILLSKGR